MQPQLRRQRKALEQSHSLLFPVAWVVLQRGCAMLMPLCAGGGGKRAGAGQQAHWAAERVSQAQAPCSRWGEKGESRGRKLGRAMGRRAGSMTAICGLQPTSAHRPLILEEAIKPKSGLRTLV